MKVSLDEKDGSKGHVELGHEHDLPFADKGLTAHVESGATTAGATEKKHTYTRSLRVFTGRYSDAPLWKVFSRPIVMWFYPGVLWGFLIYGMSENPLTLCPFIQNAK